MNDKEGKVKQSKVVFSIIKYQHISSSSVLQLRLSYDILL
jgi:hypothetical protein